MEESIKAFGIDAFIREKFELPCEDIRTYSPLTLAYIGDAIYELVVRSYVVGLGNTSANKLHRHASKLAKAGAQSAMIDILMEDLTDEELSVYRRGRNAKSQTTAKNATVGDYRKATGFEALMGYLYLANKVDRMLELIKKAVENYTPSESIDSEARN